MKQTYPQTKCPYWTLSLNVNANVFSINITAVSGNHNYSIDEEWLKQGLATETVGYSYRNDSSDT